MCSLVSQRFLVAGEIAVKRRGSRIPYSSNVSIRGLEMKSHVVVAAPVVGFAGASKGEYAEESILPTSVQSRLPPEFKHINKGRKRN